MGLPVVARGRLGLPIFPTTLACSAPLRLGPLGCMITAAVPDLVPAEGTAVPVCVLCRAEARPARGLVVGGHLLEVCPLCYALESCRALLERLELDTDDRGVVTASLNELHSFFVRAEERRAGRQDAAQG